MFSYKPIYMNNFVDHLAIPSIHNAILFHRKCGSGYAVAASPLFMTISKLQPNQNCCHRSMTLPNCHSLLMPHIYNPRYIRRSLPHLLGILLLLSVACRAQSLHPLSPSPEYERLQKSLARGWNTWDTNSVLTHVLLPEALAVRIGVKHNSRISTDEFLSSVISPDDSQITPQ